MDDTTFKLRITAYTPKTIPMVRLGEYMQAFAKLVGNEEHVHFKGLSTGSTVLRLVVEQECVPEVKKRLALVDKADAPGDVTASFKQFNKLLQDDKASATLKQGKCKVFQFPGFATPVKPTLGPIKELGELDGTIISVGGKDKIKHIRMLDSQGNELCLNTRNTELAKQLGVHLFEEVRVSGRGTWIRNETGAWELKDFIVDSFEPIASTSLVDAFFALRGMKNDGWSQFNDPLAKLADIRRN